MHTCFLIPEVSPDGLNHAHGVATYKANPGYELKVPEKHRHSDLVFLLKELETKHFWYWYILKTHENNLRSVPYVYFYKNGKWSISQRPQQTLLDYGFEIDESAFQIEKKNITKE